MADDDFDVWDVTATALALDVATLVLYFIQTSVLGGTIGTSLAPVTAFVFLFSILYGAAMVFGMDTVFTKTSGAVKRVADSIRIEATALWWVVLAVLAISLAMYFTLLLSRMAYIPVASIGTVIAFRGVIRDKLSM